MFTARTHSKVLRNTNFKKFSLKTLSLLALSLLLPSQLLQRISEWLPLTDAVSRQNRILTRKYPMQELKLIISGADSD